MTLAVAFCVNKPGEFRAKTTKIKILFGVIRTKCDMLLTLRNQSQLRDNIFSINRGTTDKLDKDFLALGLSICGIIYPPIPPILVFYAGFARH